MQYMLIPIGLLIYLGSFALGVQIFGAGSSAATFMMIVGSIGFYSVVYLMDNKSDKK